MRSPKSEITPDPKYRDKLVAKFINWLMVGGKKSTAQGILFGVPRRTLTGRSQPFCA